MSVQSGGPRRRRARAKRVRTRLDPEARRAQILEAATRVFVRGGYHGAHVDDVIREAGVARGTFYLYFESKHAVFAELVASMQKMAFDARPPIDPEEMTDPAAVERFLREHYQVVLREIRRRRDLWRLLLDEAEGADKGFSADLAEYRTAWHRRIREFLLGLAARGLAREDLDADVVAWGVVGMVEATVRRFVLPDAAPDVDRLARSLAALEMRGVLAPSPR